MAGALGIKPAAISNAVSDGKFPSSWFEAVERECDRLGVDCPTDLFSFKRSSNSAAPANAA
ncbi:hypothetical protein NBRC116598_21120 [Pseudophaeobacter arcticus]|uniref:Uncharacterized protein n=2 Tax=Pseudophaeobacter TaxID=1541822 RepID=A0ABQ0ALB6_9RHOB